MKNIGERIKIIIDEMGLNQKRLTKKLNKINPNLNLKQQYVSRYINNKANNIPNDFIIALSNFSNYSIDWILTGTKPKMKTKIKKIDKEFDEKDLKIIELLNEVPELKSSLIQYLKGATSAKKALKDLQKYYESEIKNL